MKLIYRGRNGDLYALPASHLENEDGGSAAQSDAIGRSGRGFPTSRSPWQMIFEMPCGVGTGWVYIGKVSICDRRRIEVS